MLAVADVTPFARRRNIMTKTICLVVIAMALVLAAQVSWNSPVAAAQGLIRSSHITIQCPPQCTLTVLEAGMLLGTKPAALTPASPGLATQPASSRTYRHAVEIDFPENQ